MAYKSTKKSIDIIIGIDLPNSRRMSDASHDVLHEELSQALHRAEKRGVPIGDATISINRVDVQSNSYKKVTIPTEPILTVV